MRDDRGVYGRVVADKPWYDDMSLRGVCSRRVHVQYSTTLPSPPAATGTKLGFAAQFAVSDAAFSDPAAKLPRRKNVRPQDQARIDAGVHMPAAA
jgi:hypothetical protein